MRQQRRGGAGLRSGRAVRSGSGSGAPPWRLIAALCLVATALALASNGLGKAGKAPPSGAVRSGTQPVVADADPTAVAAGTAAGTCLAFDPLRDDRHITVFVDPGHGGIDSGTSGATSDGTTVYEKDLTLATGLELLAQLRGQGYRVVMSRVDDRLLIRPEAGQLDAGALTLAGEHDDIVARITCANAAHADVLVSIHFNAFSDPAVNGAETIYDGARPFSAASSRLASLAQAAILARFHEAGWAVPNRGTMDDSAAGTPAPSAEAAAYGHVLELGPAAAGWLERPSTMPGILVEPLFLSHPAEADVAASGQGRQAIVRGLADALDVFERHG